MAIRGNRPTLKLVKEATGNPGHRPINELQPEPEGEIIRPSFVTGRARKLWDQYAPDLIEKEVLTAWDVHSFGRLCCEWAEYEKNPSVFNSARKAEMRKHETQFGLGDPAGRTRFKVSGKKKDSSDPAEKYFA